MVSRSVDVTAAALGSDGQIYRRLLGPLVRHSDQILPTVLGPLRSIPPHPTLATGRFGAIGLLPARTRRPVPERGSPRPPRRRRRPLMSPLTAPLTNVYALLLIMLAHTVGWPCVVEGGSGRIAEGLTAELASLGGRVVTDRLIQNLDELPRARATLLDLSPNQLVTLGGRPAHHPPATAVRARPLRPGGLQDGLGPGRAGAVVGRGVPSHVHRPQWAGRWPRSPTAKRRWPPAGIRLGPTASSPNLASWTTGMNGLHTCGPTATCPATPRSTWPTVSKARSNDSRPASGTW